jgi:Prokaryotic RING finger family 2
MFGENDETLCGVCLENKTDTAQTCKDCKIRLCMECWFDKCNTFCPICDRSHINKKKRCMLCEKDMFITDISICSVCGKWVCSQCEKDDYHDCEMRNVPVLTEPIMVFLLFYKNRLSERMFKVLGRFEFQVGPCFVTKDRDKAGGEVVFLVWDVAERARHALFHKVANLTHMRRYSVGNVMRGVKTYSPNGKYALDHLATFIRKMNALRVCSACNADLAETCCDSCVKCMSKKRVFDRWRKRTLQQKHACMDRCLVL